MPQHRPTPEAALQALVRAAQALAAHHRADLAQRPDPVPEYFEHPTNGLQANCLMVPVPLLNGLVRAAHGLAIARAVPRACPAPRADKPLAAAGQDC